MLGIDRVIKKIVPATLVLLCFLSGNLFGGEQFSFSWALIVKSRDGKVRSLDFEGPEPVAEGELLRIYLALHGDAFVYLFLFDSRQDLYLVFPPSGSFYNGEIPDGYQSYMPSGRNWLSLDDLDGTERFYLLASSRRLSELEKMIDSYLISKDPVLKARLVDSLDETVGEFSTGTFHEVERIPVQSGEWLGGGDVLPLIDAHRVFSGGDYGTILDLTSK